MQDHPYVTMTGRLSRNNYRTTARAVGVVFLAGMAAYIVGNAVLR
jgi:VIT1/CCC1 family predicted Fe2+/Mn2+ transporter